MNTIKSFKFILAVIILLLIVVMLFIFVEQKSKKNTTNNLPNYLKTIPTLPPTRGGGADLQADVTSQSINEIKKLTPKLPYSKSLKTTNNKSVSIYIPDKKLQNNSWTLLVYFDGINFQTSNANPDYTANKTAFIDSVRDLFGWIIQQGADPNKIIFTWGDKQYSNNLAKQWLANP